MKATAIATMTAARSGGEATVLAQALNALSDVGLPIYAADAGSTSPFTEQSRSIPTLELWEEGATLVQQIKACFRRVLATGNRVVLYTEPDKRAFFQAGMACFLKSAESFDTAAMCIAARDEHSFATFPAGQRTAERSFNTVAQSLLGIDADLLYGPFVLDLSVSAAYLNHTPDNLGWGWRTYVIARCVLAGHQVTSVVGRYSCPPEQRAENNKDVEYRLKQLQQNVEGLRLAIEHAESLEPAGSGKRLAHRLP